MDFVWNPDSSKPTGEGEMFEIIKEVEHWIFDNINYNYYLVVVMVLRFFLKETLTFSNAY